MDCQVCHLETAEGKLKLFHNYQQEGPDALTRPPKPRGRPKILNDKDVEDITRQEYLQSIAHANLKERAKLSRRMTGGKVVSASTISNVYKRKGIKFKVLGKVKTHGMGREEELKEKVENAKE